jgi:pimeloyl-[acyl-carrier protein] synthase
VSVYDRPGTTHNRLEVMRRGQASMLEMKAYLEAVIEQRRREPREDLITQLVQAEEAGDRLTTMEMVVMIVALLVGGNNSTAHLIGNAMLTLLRHPDVIDVLRAQPERVRPVIEEVLRWESPVQATSRVVKGESVEIGGQIMQPGDSVHLLIGSANRDPSQFSDPDTFDPSRHPNRHLTFAHGAHFCLGSSTARAVAQTAVLAIIQRFDDLRLVTDEPRWQPGFSFRSVESLPVRFSAER